MHSISEDRVGAVRAETIFWRVRGALGAAHVTLHPSGRWEAPTTLGPHRRQGDVSAKWQRPSPKPLKPRHHTEHSPVDTRQEDFKWPFEAHPEVFITVTVPC